MSRYVPTDIYKCPGCDGYVASGERYCKHCGRKFNGTDAASMKASLKWLDVRMLLSKESITINAFKCLRCTTFVSYGDRYCRDCGHSFTPDDVQKMGFRPLGTQDYVIVFARWACVVLFIIFAFGVIG